MSAAPRLARWLLAAMTPRRDRDQLVADVEEEFAARVVQGGLRDARRWFWRQTIFSLPSLSLHLLTDRRKRANQHGGQPLEHTMVDVRYAIRSLRRSAGFTALALLTLTLGIGATTAAFAVLDTVLLRPLPYASADRLAVLEEVKTDRSILPPSYPNFEDWRSQSQSFEQVAAVNSGQLRATLPNGRSVRALGLGVSRSLFEVLSTPPLIGRAFTAAENAPGGPSVLVVSYEFWQNNLDADPALGALRLEGVLYRVVGVMPPGFQFMRSYDVFYPLEQRPNTIRTAHYLEVVARLKDGVSLSLAQTEMSTLAQRFATAYGDQTQAADVKVTPLHEHFVGSYRQTLGLVLAASTLVLLVACTNLVSAQLARGVVRTREIAVRAALGASRGRLLRQLLVESSLLAATGGVLGSILSLALTAAVRRFGANLLPRIDQLTVDARVLAFTTISAGVVAMLIGLYPALRQTRRDPAAGLRLGTRAGAGVRRAVWRVLIGFEVAMAVILVAGAALLVRSLENIVANDVGFDIRGLVTASMSTGDASMQRVENARADLAALPGVEDVALANQLPLNWRSWSAPVTRLTDRQDRDWPAFAGFRVVTPNYFRVLRLPIQQGRAFAETDRAGAPDVAIVTPGIAQKLWPGQNPIGKVVRHNQAGGDRQFTVIGVVAEATAWRMPRGEQDEFYVPLAQHDGWQQNAIAVIRTNVAPTTLVAAASKMFRDIERDIPATIALLEDRVSASAATQRFVTFAAVTFGGIALLLAVIGIYGVLAYSVTSRRFEIGVRMALGATQSRILGETLRGAATMALIGIAVGIVAAFGATRFIRGLLYGVTTSEPAAYVIGAAVLLAAALVGAYLPARRASKVDPLLAIRADA